MYMYINQSHSDANVYVIINTVHVESWTFIIISMIKQIMLSQMMFMYIDTSLNIQMVKPSERLAMGISLTVVPQTVAPGGITMVPSTSTEQQHPTKELEYTP